jgi:2-polyprenyl-6-methoxyphenol hydroxylase-like FAD-dependent oxidoreductase
VRQNTSDSHADSPVLVVGAGPVGAVLALELARLGIQTVLVERTTAPSAHPKMDYLNARSMQLLSRLDLTAQIRARGVPPEYPFNFIWSRDFDEPPIDTWIYASVDELADKIAHSEDGTLPAEPHQRLQGSLLEEILRTAVRRDPLIDFREGWSFDGLTQDDHAVTARLVPTSAGQPCTLTVRYAVGCDGAASAVRRAVDVPVTQLGPTTRHRDVYFRSSDPVLRRHGRAFLTVAAGGLTLVSRDEQDTWTGTVHLADEAAAATDPLELMRTNLGVHFRVDEVLSVVEWDGRLAVADRYRQGRVFLAGDAAHQFYPTGGHGANTGIGDAADIAWKLAGTIQGWGGPGLLDSYETERRPVALFNREMCGNLLDVWLRFPRLVAAGASREHLVEFLNHERYQMDNLGIHLGYRYEASPLICQETGSPPRWQWGALTPSTWPGTLLPAARLSRGGRLDEQLGAGFTLLDCSDEHAGKPLADQAAERGVPMRYLHVEGAHLRALLERNLVLIRPDQHIAWRSDTPPTDWSDVLRRVAGRP